MIRSFPNALLSYLLPPSHLNIELIMLIRPEVFKLWSTGLLGIREDTGRLAEVSGEGVSGVGRSGRQFFRGGILSKIALDLGIRISTLKNILAEISASVTANLFASC